MNRMFTMPAVSENSATSASAGASGSTWPGWHLRAPMREMMHYHVRDIPDPIQAACSSRGALLEFLAGAVAAQERDLGQDAAGRRRSWWPGRETITSSPRTSGRREPRGVFPSVRGACSRRTGSQYLADARRRIHRWRTFRPRCSRRRQLLSGDLIQLEQYIDWSFGEPDVPSHQLLVHQQARINRAPGPEIASAFHVLASARPVSPQPDVGLPDGGRSLSQRRRWATLSTNMLLIKAALMVLFEAWPLSLPFDELCKAVRQRVGSAAADLPGAEQVSPAPLAQEGKWCICSCPAWWSLHVFSAPSFVTQPGRTPAHLATDPLAGPGRERASSIACIGRPS